MGLWFGTYVANLSPVAAVAWGQESRTHEQYLEHLGVTVWHRAQWLRDFALQVDVLCTLGAWWGSRLEPAQYWCSLGASNETSVLGWGGGTVVWEGVLPWSAWCAVFAQMPALG